MRAKHRVAVTRCAVRQHRVGLGWSTTLLEQVQFSLRGVELVREQTQLVLDNYKWLGLILVGVRSLLPLDRSGL